ncbi:histidinol-phosphatase [Cohaesibacter gelatinilyticus]|uniref:Histidinol-phosphatase n=1 Tax=Cohaesibacter gelatinilyticus TaxID=372072 RepID=A0A285NN46_9HYPH|nr:histidinol-phosphatase [Cohaesibacter gelatinilyticus]SNZ09286.1 myo-inositol-1(or 4)-monophosphatase [Cohaesibacter gelatinilyticus]
MSVTIKPDQSFFHSLADIAGETVLPFFRRSIVIENKEQDDFDPVTEADREAERRMREMIAGTFPEDGILGEEFESERLDADGLWVLDPIDGTRAFISGLPVWGTLIGYRHMDGTHMGMMSQPFTSERYFGDGKQSFYVGPDGKRAIESRSCASLSDATLFTTTPTLFNEQERAAYDKVEAACRLPRYGVDCYAYCMVALGMADIVIETALKPVDIAPLIPVVEGAGGIVTNWQGGSAFDGGQVVASGDKDLHEQVLEMLTSG